MSGTCDPKEVLDAYLLRANCFIPRPDEMDSLVRLVKELVEFWGRTAVRPVAPCNPS